MLSNVSWKEYLIAVGVLLVIYYLVIAVKYYRKDIRRILSGGRTGAGDKKRTPPEEEISLEELETVVFDIRYAILDRAGKHASRQELLRQMSLRLENYTGLRKPAYRNALNNAIIQHAKDCCGIVFSEEELNETWERISRS